MPNGREAWLLEHRSFTPLRTAYALGRPNMLFNIESHNESLVQLRKQLEQVPKLRARLYDVNSWSDAFYEEVIAEREKLKDEIWAAYVALSEWFTSRERLLADLAKITDGETHKEIVTLRKWLEMDKRVVRNKQREVFLEIFCESNCNASR